jgi:predicted MFS family arabinose efflux permease
LLASAAGAMSDAGVLGPSLAMAGTAFTGTAARRAIGSTSAAQSGSAIVGVPLLAAIGTVAGWRVAFVVAGCAAVAVAALAMVWLPRDNQRAAEPLRLEAILAPYRPLLRDSAMRRLLGATMIGAACWMGMLTYMGAFLAEALGLGTGHIGLVYMVAGAAYCLGSLAVGGPLARIPARSLVIFGFLAGAALIGLAFSGRVGTAWAIAAIAGMSLMWGVEGVAMTSLLTVETPSGAGTTMTLNTSLFNLGAAGGGVIGGALLALSGYEALAIGLPVFGVGASLLSWYSPRAAAVAAGKQLDIAHPSS